MTSPNNNESEQSLAKAALISQEATVRLMSSLLDL